MENTTKSYSLMPVIAGFILALGFWFVMFSPWTSGDFNFWITMMVATTTLIVLALTAGRKELGEVYPFRLSYVFSGIIAAALLYLIFLAGDFFSNLLFDFADKQVENIYATKSQAENFWIGLALFFWIGPAEEIFWRGFAQHRLMKKFGDAKGFWITTLIYAFVHIWAFNFMLFMAALICGLFWGYMYMKFKSLWPVLISHSLWDVTIFILLPIS